jgi:hydroxypyruvate reductase
MKTTTKPHLLLIEPMMAQIMAKLDALFTVHRLFEAADRDTLIAQLGEQVRGVATGGVTGLKRDIMDQLPQLGIIAINGVGTDAVDLVEARRRGICVTTTPDVLTDDVADLAMALMLAASRQLVAADRYVRAGSWGRREALPLARKVSGKRLGILGLGRIGRAVARRAEGFGMAIAYHNRRPLDGTTYAYRSTVLELAETSDILVVATSGGSDSQGLVDRAVMNALGPEGILVNISRGTVVDQSALIEALREGTLGGAALDVFANQPMVPAELIAATHVILQPHRASATIETRLAMGELVVDNLHAFFSGAAPLTPIRW